MAAISDLQSAIRANNPAVVRAVLAENPGLKTQLDDPLPDWSFDTPPLIAAVNQQNREIIDLLLEAGANINVRSKWWAGGFGVLDVCSLELAPFLIDRGAHVDIHAAARLGMLARVKELLETNPALVHARGGDGQTPLHFASSVEIAAYLLDHGAEIDARDIDHESTPAQYMLKDRIEIARYLVSRGAETDIFMAAALGDLELVRKHLDANSEAVLLSVSEKDLPKQNPESGGHIYIFTLGWGKTPHTLAWEFGHKEVFQLLMERSPWWLQLVQACEVGDEALAHELSQTEKDLPPEATSRIVGAAARNDARAVHLMLEAGWPADARGQHAQTALHWAAWRGNTSLVRELLHHNAPLDARESSYNGAPLDWALHASKNNGPATPSDYAETIQALDPINNVRPGLHP